MAKYVTVQYIHPNKGGDAIEIHPYDFAEEYDWFVKAYQEGKLIDFLVDGVSYKDTIELLQKPAILL